VVELYGDEAGNGVLRFGDPNVDRLRAESGLHYTPLAHTPVRVQLRVDTRLTQNPLERREHGRPRSQRQGHDRVLVTIFERPNR